MTVRLPTEEELHAAAQECLTLQVETVGAVEAVATASALTGVQITHRDTARAIAAANRHADRLGAAA